MKRLALLFALALFCASVLGSYQTTVVRIQEADGSPMLPAVTRIVVPNGTLTANTASQATLLFTAIDATMTAGGTTGNQTINKPAGSVNFAAASASLTVTNSFVTTASIVLCVVRTNDTSSQIKNVVPSNGSFVITLVSNATAETSVGFVVFN